MLISKLFGWNIPYRIMIIKKTPQDIALTYFLSLNITFIPITTNIRGHNLNNESIMDIDTSPVFSSSQNTPININTIPQIRLLLFI
ncbi:hypothetical protein L21TH_2079 [Caldisalinibacter kiritimatiensis]|uniref:Uncharacterized protein n=1 Tax=Caldisalinibacter kiritimatiensis TaxID=1304284 RepID=R1ATB9_9FIRM|nr:hypothetical protein L21TH_2079 [Caldisalinibacter kiritimatiensis]